MLVVDGFEGPLDWLLDLARTRRIDLARLSIVALMEAFEEALTAALATPNLRPTLLGCWGDWLVMAADFTLLRSRLLVPADAAAAQDAEDEAERLRQHLLGRAEIGRAADWLEGRDQLGRDVFARGQPDGAGVVRAGRTGDVTALLRACLVALRLSAEAGALHRVLGPPFWSLADAAARIRAMLPEVGERGPALEPSCRRSLLVRRSGSCDAGWRWRGPFWQGSNSRGRALSPCGRRPPGRRLGSGEGKGWIQGARVQLDATAPD